MLRRVSLESTPISALWVAATVERGANRNTHSLVRRHEGAASKRRSEPAGNGAFTKHAGQSLPCAPSAAVPTAAFPAFPAAESRRSWHVTWRFCPFHALGDRKFGAIALSAA